MHDKCLILFALSGISVPTLRFCTVLGQTIKSLDLLGNIRRLLRQVWTLVRKAAFTFLSSGSKELSTNMINKTLFTYGGIIVWGTS